MRFVAYAIALSACGRLEFARTDAPTGSDRDAPTDTRIDTPPPTCGARLVSTVPASGMITLDQTTLTEDATGSCGGGGKEDAVYAIELPDDNASLLVAADYPGSSADTLVHVRTTCLDATTELACSNDAGDGDNAAYHLVDPAPGAGTYYVFLDADQGGGTIVATIQVLLGMGSPCDPSSTREMCEPGNACIGNVCVPAGCTLTTTLSLPGIGSSAVTTVDTTTAVAQHASTCGEGFDGGVRANEMIIGIQLGVSARIRVTTDDLMTTFDTLVYIRDSCLGADLVCDDDSGRIVNTMENTSVAVTPTPVPPGTYYAFIDGFAWHSGVARVTISAEN